MSSRGRETPPTLVWQFSLHTIFVLTAMVLAALGVYRSPYGPRLLAYYFFLVAAAGPWVAFLVAECFPIRSIRLRTTIGHFTLLFLFIAALKTAESVLEGPAVFYVGLAALLLWAPQYMLFFVWRGNLQM